MSKILAKKEILAKVDSAIEEHMFKWHNYKG